MQNMFSDITKYPADKKIENYNFSLRAILGKGSYGTVYLGRHDKTNEMVAIKVIDRRTLVNDYFKKLLT